ncbi:hypothetical protein TNCT_639981 [Trichonephila clavata]|uniref:Uncharacterized protein n=1 Tax=Trichonephila clavata TaxID=2740835 RepID=A0A8X6IYR5_TRICU|nr:hypothetical protein TNCT_639981 [Trichonephila clavata]
MGDSFLVSYILPPLLDSDKYLVLLQELLPKLLPNVPAPVWRCMWFQRDGVPSSCGTSSSHCMYVISWIKHFQTGDWAWWSRRLTTQIP